MTKIIILKEMRTTTTLGKKRAPKASAMKSEQAVNAARRQGLAVETQAKWGAGSNKQHVTTKNTAKLDRETEELKHDTIPLDVGKLIQQGRQAKGLSQKDLATKINEKPQVITDYEAGRGVPNNIIIGKIERVIGLKLRGKDRDFNIPSFNIDNTDNKHILINNFMELCDLQQSNNVSNTNNRYLDLVFSNIHNTTSKYDMPLVCEDRHHPSLLIEFSIKLSHTSDFLPNKVEHVFNFRKANYPLLYELVFSADWSDVLLSDDVDSASVKFEQILHGIFEKTVPFKIVPRRKFPPWFSVETIRKIKQKHRAHKKFKKNGSQIHYEQFLLLRNEIKTRIADEHRNFVLQAEIGIKTDPSNFWSYIRNKKGNSRIPGIMRYGDQTYTNQQDIVNGFASYFSSIYSTVVPASTLNADILSVLGDETGITKVYGPPIHKHIADRWLQILKSGLVGEKRKELISKYPAPDNSPPKLNAIVRQAINDSVVKRDERLTYKQTQIGVALSAIGSVISELLEKQEADGDNKSIIERLSDAGRLLSDLHRSESATRRDLASLNLNKEWRDTLSQSISDEWLFGEDLEGRIEQARTIQQSSDQLKPTKLAPRKVPSARSSLNPKSPLKKFRGSSQSRRYQHQMPSTSTKFLQPSRPRRQEKYTSERRYRRK
nr:unnamed protein product [Callosobruchus chinensis]